MAAADDVSDAAVRAFISAINAGDRDAFFAVLAPGATMSDDGTERDLVDWVDREIFNANGHLDVESVSDAGRSLIASYSNDTWGAMRTRWSFTTDGDKVTRFETGQAG